MNRTKREKQTHHHGSKWGLAIYCSIVLSVVGCGNNSRENQDLDRAALSQTEVSLCTVKDGMRLFVREYPGDQYPLKYELPSGFSFPLTGSTMVKDVSWDVIRLKGKSNHYTTIAGGANSAILCTKVAKEIAESRINANPLLQPVGAGAISDVDLATDTTTSQTVGAEVALCTIKDGMRLFVREYPGDQYPLKYELPSGFSFPLTGSTMVKDVSWDVIRLKGKSNHYTTIAGGANSAISCTKVAKEVVESRINANPQLQSLIAAPTESTETSNFDYIGYGLPAIGTFCQVNDGVKTRPLSGGGATPTVINYTATVTIGASSYWKTAYKTHNGDYYAFGLFNGTNGLWTGTWFKKNELDCSSTSNSNLPTPTMTCSPNLNRPAPNHYANKYAVDGTLLSGEYLTESVYVTQQNDGRYKLVDEEAYVVPPEVVCN